MGKIHYSPGISVVTGALDSKHELIGRQKHLHAPDGSITKTCEQEAYYQANKRDYKQKPPKGGELAHLRHFGEAARQTTALIHAFKNPDQASEEEQTLVQQYLDRFNQQIKGEPDPQAPTDKYGKQKHYYRFDNFIRAMIYQKLKTD